MPPRVTDVRSMPGDFVMPRGGRPIRVYLDCGYDSGSAGAVSASSIGIVVSTFARAWTYVLWSNPSIMGWIDDGHLRRLRNHE